MESKYANLFVDKDLVNNGVVNTSGIFIPALNDRVYVEGDVVPDGIKSYSVEEINILFSLDEVTVKLCHSMKQVFNGNISLREIIEKVEKGTEIWKVFLNLLYYM